MIEVQVIGFVGLGNMGGAIARVLAETGTPMIVFDIDPAAVQRVVDCGASPAGNVREIVDRASLLLTCLPSPLITLDVAREAAFGRRVEIVGDLSTSGRRAIIEASAVLAAHGKVLVDAPVSGGPLGALQKTLSLMLAGPSAQSRTVAQACAPACGHITQIGEVAGQAQLSKIVNNGISMTAFLVSCEAFATAAGSGLSINDTLETVNAGIGCNSATVTKLPKYILNRTFNMGGSLGSALKDQDLFLDEFRQAGFTGGVVQGTRALWGHIASRLDPHTDAATIVTYFEHFAQAQVVYDELQAATMVRIGPRQAQIVSEAIGYTVLAATCEAIAVGLAGGIARASLLEALNAGTARNYWTETLFAGKVENGRATIAQVQEALTAYLEMAGGTGLPHGLVHHAAQVWERAAKSMGKGASAMELLDNHLSWSGRMQAKAPSQ